MTSPRDGRERLLAILVAGVAVVLLVSSVTWFASDQAVVGVAQLFLAAVLEAWRRSCTGARSAADRRARGTSRRHRASAASWRIATTDAGSALTRPPT